MRKIIDQCWDTITSHYELDDSDTPEIESQLLEFIEATGETPPNPFTVHLIDPITEEDVTSDIDITNLPKGIYIVYLTYVDSVELMFAFESKENAEAKQFELCRKWVHEDKFNQYLKNNKITEIDLETFADYFREVEDDSYVGINKVILEA